MAWDDPPDPPDPEEPLVLWVPQGCEEEFRRVCREFEVMWHYTNTPPLSGNREVVLDIGEGYTEAQQLKRYWAATIADLKSMVVIIARQHGRATIAGSKRSGRRPRRERNVAEDDISAVGAGVVEDICVVGQGQVRESDRISDEADYIDSFEAYEEGPRSKMA